MIPSLISLTPKFVSVHVVLSLSQTTLHLFTKFLSFMSMEYMGEAIKKGTFQKITFI